MYGADGHTAAVIAQAMANDIAISFDQASNIYPLLIFAVDPPDDCSGYRVVKLPWTHKFCVAGIPSSYTRC